MRTIFWTGGSLILLFFIFVIGGVAVPNQVVALSTDEEIEAAFQEILDRDPTDIDYQNNRTGFISREKIKKELNNWPERRWAIERIYQRALGRIPLEREIVALRTYIAENNRIREQLFNATERSLAIKNVYSRYLDRNPKQGALEFYKVTRSNIGDILSVLNGSGERRDVMVNLVMQELGRQPTDDEIVEFLKKKADRLGIARGLRNPLIINVTDSLGNTQENSWAVEHTGSWSAEAYQIDLPTITVGDKITFTVRAIDFVTRYEVEDEDTETGITSIEDKIEIIDGKVRNKIYYKFTVGNNHDIIQDWSTSNTAIWSVDVGHVGRLMPVTVWVKDNNLIERMGDGLGDDYTYLTYNILSGSDNGDAVIADVTDSLGNVQDESWMGEGDSSYQWSEYPELTVGDELTFTATATDSESDDLIYQFTFFNSGGASTIVQEWSSVNTYTWGVGSDSIGPMINICVGVKDNNNILAAGDNGDDWICLTYKVVSGGDNKNPILLQVIDSNSNIQDKSAAGPGDDTYQWSEYPVLHVGDIVSFTASATDEEDDDFVYQFTLFDYSGAGTVVQEWSSINTYTWVVTDDYVGPNINVHVAVKDGNGELWFGDFNGDDWLYLTYQVWE